METNNIETSIKFSLVLCTLGRKDCVDSFLWSLEKQSYKKFECIIVDQNETDMLLPIVDKYASKFSVVYIRSSIKGLSKNRNIGVNRALGNAFPEDDCEYLPNTLEVMSSLFFFFFNTASSLWNERLPLFHKLCTQLLKH